MAARFTALTRLVDDGQLPVDSNWIENQIRPISSGRNNWLFAGSLRAGIFATDPQTVLWAVGFALGGMGGAVYTLMIVELGHRLGDPIIVKAVAALVTACSLSTAVGPTVGGATYDAGGITSLALLLLAFSRVGIAVALRELRLKPDTLN